MKTKRKILSLLPAFCLAAVLLPTTALAAGDATVTDYGLSVHGIKVTSENKDDVLGDLDGPSQTVTFDPATNTLTLNNASFPSTSGKEDAQGSIIYVPDSKVSELNIHAIGTNTLMRVNVGANTRGTLTFTGPGTINLTGQYAQIYPAPDNVDLVFDGITLNVDAHSSDTGYGNTAIDGNNITVKNGAQIHATADAWNAITTGGNISIEGNSVVTAESTAQTGNFNAIYAWGKIMINQSTVTTTSGNTSLVADEGISISGSQVTATSHAKRGINSKKSVTITDGSNVTANGYTFAIRGNSGVSISDSTVNASSSTDVTIFSQNNIGITNSVVNADAPEGTEGIKASIAATVSDSWISTSGAETFENNITNSVLINGTSGRVIGNAVIPGDVTIPEGTTLEVPADAHLNIPAGKTVTNNGTVVLNGTLEGDPLTGNVTHTAHDWSADWTLNDTHHWHNCVKENCPLADSDKDGYDVHAFKWVTTKEATSTEEGSKHEECTVCGYKKAAVAVPATGAAADPSGTPAASADNKANATATPATGDNSNIALWVFSLLAAGAALGGTYIYSRKRRHSK